MWRIVIWIGIAIGGTCYAAGEEGVASVYSEGQAVACGGRLATSAMTAAHKSLPCGSKVKVTNKSNGKSVTVTINDRGPFVAGRIIDLTPAAARALGIAGLGRVSVGR